jgi:predicted signal transduction protein with EAL and GGDEF domain
MRARRADFDGRFRHRYSSLSYLRSFPFDKTKIDQSFVRCLAASRARPNAEIVELLQAQCGADALASAHPDRQKVLVA